MTVVPDDPRRVLARHGLTAKKSWGQNFLRDRAVLARIAAAARATADDVVVEIGAGLGALTAALAATDPPPARIVAIERDPDMLRVLAAELGASRASSWRRPTPRTSTSRVWHAARAVR